MLPKRRGFMTIEVPPQLEAGLSITLSLLPGQEDEPDVCCTLHASEGGGDSVRVPLTIQDTLDLGNWLIHLALEDVRSLEQFVATDLRRRR